MADEWALQLKLRRTRASGGALDWAEAQAAQIMEFSAGSFLFHWSVLGVLILAGFSSFPP